MLTIENVLQPGRNFKTLSALEQTASAQKAQLLPAEIVAVRLFSGPMGVVYNGILEGRAEEGGGGGRRKGLWGHFVYDHCACAGKRAAEAGTSFHSAQGLSCVSPSWRADLRPRDRGGRGAVAVSERDAQPSRGR